MRQLTFQIGRRPLVIIFETAGDDLKTKLVNDFHEFLWDQSKYILLFDIIIILNI